MIEKIKLALRINHTKLDDDIQADIDACLADLRLHGIIYAEEDDPLIFNAIKLYCRSTNTDDPGKAAAWLERYESLRACLQIAEGYGWRADDE
jgi:hypothetical protein